ncbi:hypothetical protein SteCoe_32695 [Stentor coeruleus]|uniref:Uncharacterized protein n=1 Tax=Stentor coeruleus TaxID=5963 RepID=A0A1R2AYE6_9CILI|nr:hypothetical protein SteCoe_32695 [Stentor coeruleus]
MEERSEADKLKFLYILGGPYKSLCKILTLKSGVLLISVIDIIFGIVCFIYSIKKAVEIITESSNSLNLYVRLFRLIVHVFAIPFSIFAIRGCYKLDFKDITKYADFKIVEFFLLTFSSVMIDISTENNDKNTEMGFMNLMFMIFLRLVLIFVIKVVWSAKVRLRYNEFMLFVHGEEALKFMQQPIDMKRLSRNVSFDETEI